MLIKVCYQYLFKPKCISGYTGWSILFKRGKQKPFTEHIQHDHSRMWVDLPMFKRSVEIWGHVCHVLVWFSSPDLFYSNYTKCKGQHMAFHKVVNFEQFNCKWDKSVAHFPFFLKLILRSGMGVVFWEKIAMIYSGLFILQ